MLDAGLAHCLLEPRQHGWEPLAADSKPAAGDTQGRVPRGQPRDDSSALPGVSTAGTLREGAAAAALRSVLDGCRPTGPSGVPENGRTDGHSRRPAADTRPGHAALTLTAGPTSAPGAPQEATAGNRRPVPIRRTTGPPPAAPRPGPCLPCPPGGAAPPQRRDREPRGSRRSRLMPGGERRAEPQASEGGRRREARAGRRRREEGREQRRAAADLRADLRAGSPALSLRSAPFPPARPHSRSLGAAAAHDEAELIDAALLGAAVHLRVGAQRAELVAARLRQAFAGARQTPGAAGRAGPAAPAALGHGGGSAAARPLLHAAATAAATPLAARHAPTQPRYWVRRGGGGGRSGSTNRREVRTRGLAHPEKGLDERRGRAVSQSAALLLRAR